MDIASHGLWGGIAFGRKNKKSFWLAFLFGVAPDLFSFGPYFAASWIGLAERPEFSSHPPPVALKFIPTYVFESYKMTHSFIIFAAAFLIAWLIFRRPVLEMLAWGFHVILDIFTHNRAFFPTPFLWPLSSYTFDGWSWGQPYIWFPNIGALIVLYLIFFLGKKRLTGKQYEQKNN